MNAEVDIAWAAGLFEGEGCVTTSTRSSDGFVRFVSLQMTMCDLEIVEKFVRIVGSSTKVKTHPGVTENRQERHMWQTNKISEVVRIFSMLRPYLGSRRRSRYDELIKAYYASRGYAA